ncbi:MAG: glycosyltransferase [Cyclobacteriaceae bacterium]|nr:glycosyltransferase [Cyclobacteriaceae bacterium]
MAILEVTVLVYFSFVTVYISVCFIGCLLYKDKKFHFNNKNQNSFHILIPAYKEDAIILSSVKENLKQNYPIQKFKITVIADSLQPNTITQLQDLNIEVLIAQFDFSTKVKSLNLAIQHEPSNFDYTVILDADNILEPNYLLKVNELHNDGYQAIQTQRIPKNQDTNMAFLDGLSEALNYNLISKPGVSLKLSPGLKGSGMSFNSKILKELLSNMTSVGGFDRELELKLLQRGISIYYSHNTVVQDEKVSSIEVFKRQRTRWVASQFIYLQKYFVSGVVSFIKNRNLAYFNSAVLRNIQLPRLVNFGLLFMLSVTSFLFRKYIFFDWQIWCLLFLINLLILLLSVPKHFYSLKIVRAAFYVPSVFFNMLLVFLKLKGANKKFIHTPKTSDSRSI